MISDESRPRVQPDIFEDTGWTAGVRNNPVFDFIQDPSSDRARELDRVQCQLDPVVLFFFFVATRKTDTQHHERPSSSCGYVAW